MGVNASSYPHSCSPRFGGNSQTQQTFIGTSYSPQGYGCEGKLYSLEGGGGAGGGPGERPQDRKKKSSGLATLKRRFIKRRKSSRSADHARQLRELLAGWDVRDAHALVEEYEGTAALKELSLAAGLARPHARTLQRDLAELYRLQLCTDVELLFQDARFPAHRALLAARCPFLGSLLASSGVAVSGGGVSPGVGAQMILDVGAAAGAAGVGMGMDPGVFSTLLYYLYTGELGGEETRLRSGELLLRLGEEFGTPNSLEADMRVLWERMSHHDSLLCFASDAELEASPTGGAPGGVGGVQTPMGPGPSVAAAAAAAVAAAMMGEEELRAHKAVLSARSPFFRSLLQRRTRAGAGPAGEEPPDPHTPPLPTCIVLDESIIPKKYARVILHCMYTDRVELSLVLRGSPSAGSLGEVQALVAGRGGGMTRAEEAMELYHIALFLEFSMLAQGCEDIIAESVCLESLVPILKWSSQPYGSKWVHRQAMHFLCEDFSQVVTSDVLHELSKDQLLAAIQSDYLQASEHDILKYVVKWGEQQLIKRMADREPNLLSGTAHSVNKRGVKRRDLDVEELKEILSPLLPYVRTEHILPQNSEVLSDTMKRGLISTPPSDMLPTAEGGKANAWLRQKSAGIYVRPRLFSPYVEEAKAILDEMMVEQTDLVRLRMVRMSNVPDTLYMVTNAVPQCCHMINHQQMPGGQTAPPSVVANEIPVPPLCVVRKMIQRMQELRHTEQVQRAYALNCGEGATVSYELQLRVLREFSLPDGAAELLQNPHKFFPEERFGDESPILALRQVGRCRVNSTPAGDSLYPELESLVGFHPPLPPPPPPYHHPSGTPAHGQMKSGWRPRATSQPPSRSFSYPCNHALLQRTQPLGPQVPSPAYPSAAGHGKTLMPPDCTNFAVPGRSVHPDKQGNMEPVMNEFMPDIAMGVSAMTLKECRMPEVNMELEGHDPHPLTTASIPHGYIGRHPHSSSSTCSASRKRHAAESKLEAPPDFPDLYELSGRLASATYAGPPDLYSHGRPPVPGAPAGALSPGYAPDQQPPCRDSGLRLDMLEQPPQRLDLALATHAAHAAHAATAAGQVAAHRAGRPKNETDLTCGLGSPPPPPPPPQPPCPPEPYEEWARRQGTEGTAGAAEDGGIGGARERRSPSKPEYPYRKSAL
ncbi:BTB/POZ domain-containing protein 7 isoform X2 [Clupea harengus]|uniref:BTB/POZ domain-containing protein 7 isoform X2 n=1 Tax=Clupea harengus TaxID=7950 RepID=A0A6P3VRK1_CLUHA|nr:BTB/POZ domain-containing protein 7 isoform X2 [Clupea harengus]